MERLDNYTELPSGMKEYLSNYGWHFSKKMYEFAVSNMISNKNESMKIYSKEEIDSFFKTNGVSLMYHGYDAPFVYCMAKSDFYGSSILSESNLCRFVKDYLNDIDGYDTIAFTRFYADCIAKGIPIIWEDLM